MESWEIESLIYSLTDEQLILLDGRIQEAKRLRDVADEQANANWCVQCKKRMAPKDYNVCGYCRRQA